MSWENIIQMAFVGAAGIVVSILGYFIKSSMAEVKGSIDCITSKVNDISRQVTCLREEMLRDYVMKKDFDNIKSEDRDGHKEIWQELNRTKERVARIEK